MRYRKTFTQAFEEVKSRNLKEQEEQTEFSKDDVEKLKDEITQLKLQLQQAKDKTSKPVPNKDTGEIPLQTGIGHAILKLKDREEKEQAKAKQASKKIEKLAKESLVKNVVDVMRESEASDKAKSLGLDYLSFGRYGKDGKVTHKSIRGTLTAVDKNEKPIKEPEKGKPGEPADKAAGEPDKEQQSLQVKKQALDILGDKDYDIDNDLGVHDGGQSEVEKVVKKLRDAGESDLANELEEIIGDVAEMEEDALEKFDDFVDRLKGKTPPTETAIKNFNKVNDVYSDQTYSNDNINDYVKDSVNYLKSLSKVLDAGEGYGDTSFGKMKGGALRKDQIEVLQDAMGTFKDVLDNMVDNVGYDENDPDSHTIDEIEADIEYIEDPLSDHDDYTKVGKVTGTLEDMMDKIKKLGETEPAPKKESLGEESEKDKKIRLKDLVMKSAKKKIKLDNKKTKIEIDPETTIGQSSGGTTVDTGNLH